MDPLTGGLLAQGIPALGSILSSGINAVSLQGSSHQNRVFGRWQVGQQREENELNRQFQAEQLKNQQDWNREQWNLENEYNSPENQMKLLRAAGINPAAYLANEQGLASAAAAPVSMGAPSVGSSGSVGTSVTPSMPVQVQNPFAGFAESMRSFAEAKKAGVESERLDKLMDSELDKLISEKNLNEIGAQIRSIERDILSSTKDTRVKQAVADYEKTLRDVLLSDSQADLVQLKSVTEQLQHMLLSRDIDMKDVDLESMKTRLKYLESDIKATIDEKRASAQESRAKADEASASAEQTKIFNRLYNDARFRHSFMSQVVDDARQKQKQLKMTDKQIEQLNYLCDKLAYETDMQAITYWSDRIFKLIDSVGSAASQFYGAGALRELMNMRGMMSKPQLHSGAPYALDPESGILFKKPW